MRVAVLSDIHSNAPALEAVLEAVGAVDQALGARRHRRLRGQPDEVVARLSARGRHRGAGQPRCRRAGAHHRGHLQRDGRATPLTWTASAISPTTLAWLASLPERRVEGEFTLVHGSPREPLWEYLYSVPAARAALRCLRDPLLPRRPHPPAGRVPRRCRPHRARAVADGVRLAARRAPLHPQSRQRRPAA